ncbi:MAG: caspase family protein [Propionicimonas sp.]
MTKRALCVGINDYPLADMDLKGCVNDAKDWAGLLVGHYDFAKPDVKMLLNKSATKAGILRELGKLLAGAASGDVLVFTNSSHGTYVADKDGDEAVYDEAMCPWDSKDNLLVDDELRSLFSGLKPGVRLTVVSDSCFSGTVTRALDPVQTPDDRRRRFLNPKRIGRPEIADLGQARPRSGGLHPESVMKEVLVSGCNDKQYSFDARIDGRYNGAMTANAIRVIKNANYRLSYNALRTKLVAALEESAYDQEPQLEGRASARGRQLFT